MKNPENDEPIFIIGTERSGSNLLRLMLNAHSRIAIPHPPHIMRDFSPIVTLYGDLNNDAIFHRLVRDVVKVVEMHFSPWQIKPEITQVMARAPSRSLYGIYCALYEIHRESVGKPRWGCKSTFMYRHIDEIRQHHRKPRFLHLVRDPRDVAASADSSVFSKFHPYHVGLLWAKEQGEISSCFRSKEKNLILTVRYEDLVSSPEATIARIMEFLGEEFEKSQMEYFRTQEAVSLARLSTSWKNCNSPISQNSVGRFKKDLKPEAVKWVELAAANMMAEFGYSPIHRSGKAEITALKKLGLGISENLRKIKVEFVAMSTDRNFLLRWKRTAFLAYLRFSLKVSRA